MSADLLARLRSLDVTLTADGGRLRCNAPKGVLTPELQQQLAANKDALLTLLREEHEAGNGEPSSGPLSFPQERIWFMEQLQPGLAAYNMPGGVHLRGSLDIASLERAIAEIVRRHGALRTTFDFIDDEPIQRVHQSMSVPITMLDVSALSGDAQERRVLELAWIAAHERFDLSRGPLLRATLLRLAPDHHVFLVTMHHIVSDGWSIGIFIAELAALYGAFITGGASPLPALPVQYIDYARTQRRRLHAAALAEQLAYWKRHLGDELPATEVPADFARPADMTFAGAIARIELPPPLVERLKSLARAEHATFFMVMLSAFEVLLARYAGLTDVVVGTPIANRTELDTERLIGFFANLLVFRNDLSGEPSFRELLQRVRAVAVEAYAHQDVPFGRIVEELQPVRDPGRTPLFHVLFSLQNAPLERLALPGLVLTTLSSERGTTKGDLSLEVIEYGDSAVLTFEYSTQLYEPATIARVMRHYETLLRAVAEEPGRPITQLPMLSADETRQMLVGWNDTAVEHDRTRAVHHLLEASAMRTPDAVAVQAGDVTLSYRELDARANQLARLLIRRAAGAGGCVAVCVDRTEALPIALAAVLKTGAAYVPIDPAYPSERVAFILEDAGVHTVITESRFVALFADGRIPVVILDQAASDLAAESTAPPGAPVHADDLAYVIYTSGSTGQPKGVEVEHRNVVNLLSAMEREPGIGASDVLLAVTTIAFDIAGLELWLPLAAGARIILAARDDALDPLRLIALIERHAVSVVQATPSTWRLLIDAGWTGKPTLKALCGGEALSVDLANTLSVMVRELWNMYGPTETTIWSTIARIAPGDTNICIGRPIANTRVYILDAGGQPAPIGAAGEMLIAGEGVARGYRNRPALTAAEFTEITIPGRGVERVYRTGDIARWRVDGVLEHLGRRDAQVKVRGHRIELGEIEAVLRTHPGVRDGVVIVRELTTGDRAIVAYAVMRDDVRLDEANVRATLRKRLPEFMVPSFFETLPVLPRTPNGKIDRKALPEPRIYAGTGDDTAMTADQRRIADIWRRILGRESVGLHQNFFDVGGQSFLAIKLRATLQRELNVDFPLLELFQHTTIAEQAVRLAALEGGGDVAAGRQSA